MPVYKKERKGKKDDLTSTGNLRQGNRKDTISSGDEQALKIKPPSAAVDRREGRVGLPGSEHSVSAETGTRSRCLCSPGIPPLKGRRGYLCLSLIGVQESLECVFSGRKRAVC